MSKYLFLLCALLIVTSCEKEEPEPENNDNEIIDPPQPLVDLNCHFTCLVNGTSVELTQNVSGYSCNPSFFKILLPPPDFSSINYFTEMSSSENSLKIKIGLGTIYWDAATTSNPTLTVFNDFFTNSLTPNYANDAVDGFTVEYHDNSGTVWRSQENSINPQSVIFSNITQESDQNGDYNQFDCSFNCYVYHQDESTLLWDSLKIDDAQFKAWFKR